MRIYSDFPPPPTVRGQTIRTQIWYPRNSLNPNCVSIELVDVRAANSIYVQYDFDRDGWAITMPHPNLDEDGREVLHEVAFVSAWASGESSE